MMNFVEHNGRKGFWMAMGHMRLPVIRWKLKNGVFYMEEIAPAKLYDRNGMETDKIDYAFVAVGR